MIIFPNQCVYRIYAEELMLRDMTLKEYHIKYGCEECIGLDKKTCHINIEEILDEFEKVGKNCWRRK